MRKMLYILTMSLFIAVQASVPVSAKETAVAGRSSAAVIESISAQGNGDSTELVIIASSRITYTSYKNVAPPKLVVDLSSTSPGKLTNQIAIDRGNFKGVSINRFDTEAGVLTRLEIDLYADREPAINALKENPGEIRISFPAVAGETTGTQAASASMAKEDALVINEKSPSPAETDTSKKTESRTEQPPVDARQMLITAITASDSVVTVKANSSIAGFKTLRLAKPERFVVDIPDAKSGMAEKLIPLKSSIGISSARIGLYPDKIRIVFDAANGSIPDLKAETNGDTLLVKPVNTLPETSKQKTAEIVRPPAVQEKPEFSSQKKSQPVIESSEPQPAAVKKAGPGVVDSIDFQVVDAITRISIKVSGDPAVEPPVATQGFVTLTIKNTRLPKNLQRSVESRNFITPVLRVTPLVVKSKNVSDTRVRIAMRMPAEPVMRREADIIHIEFKHPEGMTAEKLQDSLKSGTTAKASSAKASAKEPDGIPMELAQVAEVKSSDSSKKYSGRRVTLEFADAEVRKIFQLLAEVSNKNFVLGDEVGGNISIKLVNVPWDQALDIILDTKGLEKREDGNVMTIRGKGKFKSDTEIELDNKKLKLRSAELKTEMFSVNYASIGEIVTQFNSLKSERGVVTPDARTNKIIVKDVQQSLDDMRVLIEQLDKPEKQVMIEARIVVATSEFTRDFGVQWGLHYKDGTASLMGINGLDTGFGGIATAPPTSQGQFGSSGMATGISFGTLGSNIQLDMRLSAATAANMVKVVASPKVVTLNHEPAKIEQGQSTFVQTLDGTGKPNATSVTATLKLEVTPSINSNNTITLKIDASDDSFGTPPAGATSVAINKRTATSKILLRDGETAVIGGIFRDQENEGSSGVPYLKEIPLLGHLFKSSTTVKKREELLIFITPRVIDKI